MSADHTIRQLEEFVSPQYAEQYFALLQQLTVAPEMLAGAADKILMKMLVQGTELYVAEIDGLPVGTCSLVLEQKLIHNGGLVARIEDVVTDNSVRGKGIGIALVRHALESARESGAYKVVLDCSDRNVGFYEKLGFVKRDNFMRLDL